MHWDDDAEAAVSKAPFFIRGKIRKRCEDFVSQRGGDSVTLAEVETMRQQAMGDMPEKAGEEKIQGMTAQQIEKIVENTRVQVVSKSRFYDLKVCGGAFGCPRTLFDVNELAEKIIETIENSDVPSAVEKRAKGPILAHNKLRLSISGCLNSCSQPQIADCGIQGRARVAAGQNPANESDDCINVCHEGALSVRNGTPVIDRSRCIDCGDCAMACENEAIVVDQHGFSLLVGGKLGRHPQLAETLSGFTDEQSLLAAIQVVCDIFAHEMLPEERFADTVNRLGIENIRNSASARS